MKGHGEYVSNRKIAYFSVSLCAMPIPWLVFYVPALSTQVLPDKLMLLQKLSVFSHWFIDVFQPNV